MDKRDIKNVLFVYFNGMIPEKYKSFVQQWLVSDYEKEEKELEIRELWENINIDDESLDTYEALDRVLVKYRRRRRLTIFCRCAAVASLLVVGSLCVYYFMGRQATFEEPHMVTCCVPKGHVSTITLADGTKITVNAGSVIRYPDKMVGSTRDVYLSGEALFDVTHDANHPFTVHANGINIEDLGTRFNIRAYDTLSVTTTLIEGSAQVYRSASEPAVELSPNEQAVYTRADHKIRVNQVDAADYTLWTEGEMSFDQCSLGEILQSLERKFNVIIKPDKHLNLDSLYTLYIYKDESIDDVMRLLTRMGDYSYRKSGNTILLIKQ